MRSDAGLHYFLFLACIYGEGAFHNPLYFLQICTLLFCQECGWLRSRPVRKKFDTFCI